MQHSLDFPNRHGGARAGAGRKKTPGRSNVAHRARSPIPRGAPVHVTLRVSRAVGNLRTKRRFVPIRDGLRASAERFGCRLVHFSVQKNHLHLLVEPHDRRALTRAMKGLQVRLAKSLNKVLRRCGQVFSDRYHAQVLTSPRQVRNAIAYVLLNARKHAWETGTKLPARWVDPYSSARWFDGFANAPPSEADVSRIGCAPARWLLSRGWRRTGLIRLDEIPGRSRKH